MKEPVETAAVGERTDVALRGRSHEVTRALAEINFDNLTSEVQNVGGTAIWWGVLHAHAQADVGRAKLRVEVIEGQTAKQLRRDRNTAGEKVTDKIIEEETSLHRDVQTAKEELIRAEERANILRAVQFAVEQKQRTLTALSGALAREMGANHVDGADALRSVQRGRMPDRRAVRD